MSSECFSKMEIDAIGEILNISLGASATAVSTMLNARVDITTPVVNVVSKEEFQMDRVEPAVGVEITYVAGLEGENVMLLKRHDVKVIVEMLMGMEMSDEDFELNEMNISAVCEVMNQMMGASATALSEFLGETVNISTPISYEVKSEEEFVEKYFTDDMPKVMVAFTLRIADKLESEFFNVMPMELAKGLVKGFLPEEDIVDISSVMSDSSSGAESVESKPAASSGGMMSQEEIEKLLQGGAGEAETAPQSAPVVTPTESEPTASSGGMMSQEEIEKLLQGGVGEEVAVSQPASVSETVVQPAVSPAEATPQPTMTTGTVSQQPAMAADAIPQQQPMMAAQPMMSPEVSMMQMQMMQQMMQQIQQMQAAQQQMMENKKEVSSEPKMIRAHAPSTPSLKQDTEIAGGQEENMELILGVPLEISVEIGRTKKLVKDILDFTKGSLVVLDKLAGEQVDLFVNGQCIAKGDVVVVEDNFGIRITEIMKVNFTALE